MATVLVSESPIDPRTLEAEVSTPESGAVLTFIGQVRSHARGRQVSFLEYSAYKPMAQKELLRIAAAAEEKWPVRIALQHRLGRLEIGEASIVVSVSSPHRAAAFDACRWCMDTLKTEVPIWKKETCPDGSFWIEGETAVG